MSSPNRAQRIAPVAIVAALFLVTAPATGSESPPVVSPDVPTDPCKKRYRLVDQVRYISDVYHRPDVSRRASRKIDRMRRCSRSWRASRVALRHLRQQSRARRDRAIQASLPPHLHSIAQCESGGDPTAISSGGTYRGKYQFDMGTWASVGGSGDPAAAPEHEQDRRAAILYRSRGWRPWPVCGAW